MKYFAVAAVAAIANAVSLSENYEQPSQLHTHLVGIPRTVYDEKHIHVEVEEERTREVPRTVYDDVVTQGTRPTVETGYRFEEDTKTRTVTTVTYEDVQERKERTKYRTETVTRFRDVVQNKYRTVYRDEVVNRSRDEVVTKYRTEVRDKKVIKYKEVPVDAVREVSEDVDLWKKYPETTTRYVTETKQRTNHVEKTCDFQDTRLEDRTKTVVEYREVEEEVTELVPVTRYVTETKQRANHVEKTCDFQDTRLEDRTRTVVEYREVEETVTKLVPQTKYRTVTINGEEKTEEWIEYVEQEFTNRKYKPFNVDQHYQEEVTFTNTRDCSYDEVVDYTVKTPYDVTIDTPVRVTE